MRLSVDWKGLPGVMAKGANATQWVTAVNVALVVLLAYQAAVLSWRLVPAAEREALPALQMASSQQPVVASGGWNIARWSLFGKENQNAPTPVMVQKEIPKTTLKLTLRGVFVSDDGGGAIIAEANGKERYYSINSNIPGGVVLKEVHPTKVVLKRNNKLEILELPKESVNVAGSSTRARNTSSRSRGRSAGPMNLKQYRKDLLKEPQRLTDAIKMNPKSERGKFIGYEVKPGRDRALFDRVGLMSGDIVTSVNGIQLDTPAKGLNVLRSLQTANSVRLDIKRNGRSQSLDVSID